MISPSAHEPCTFLNFQIHFSVFLLSLNLIVLFPNNEFCTITICFSFIFIFSLIMHACLLSCVQLFVTLWTVAHKVLLSMGLSGQQYWRGLPYPPPEDLPNPGIKPVSPSPELAGDYHWANWEVPYFTCCGQFCWVTLYILQKYEKYSSEALFTVETEHKYILITKALSVSGDTDKSGCFWFLAKTRTVMLCLGFKTPLVKVSSVVFPN